MLPDDYWLKRMRHPYGNRNARNLQSWSFKCPKTAKWVSVPVSVDGDSVSVGQPVFSGTTEVSEPGSLECPFPADLELPDMVYIWTDPDGSYAIETLDEPDTELLVATLKPERTDDWDWIDSDPDANEPERVSFDYAMAFAKEEELDGVFIAEPDRVVYII